MPVTILQAACQPQPLQITLFERILRDAFPFLSLLHVLLLLLWLLLY